MPDRLKKLRKLALPVAVIFAALLAAAIVTGWRGAMRPPRVVRYDLTVAMPPSSRALRIAFLSDTHAGWPDMPPSRLESVVAQVNALKPDLILLGGDYVKGVPLDIGSIAEARAIEPLHRLQAPLGVVAVLGNNDCAHGGGTRAAALLKAGGIRVLRNDAVLLPGVTVLGVDDGVYCNGNMGPTKIAYTRQLQQQGQQQATAPVILLAHEPMFAPYAPPYAGVFLAGHTHGGQMFPAIVGRISAWQSALPKARGVMTVNGRPVVVTSGVGTNNLPLRIGVPPEIVLLTIRPR